MLRYPSRSTHAALLAAALASALASGCFNPRAVAPECRGVPCPGYAVCVDGVCILEIDPPVDAEIAAPEVDAPDPDPDRDGVTVNDNCPTVANPPRATLGEAQPIQRDHDGDGRGDECDLCPHISSTADTDTDLDSIGDACDPQPSIRNPPTIFDGFYDPPDARWSVPRNAGLLSDWQVARLASGKIGWRQSVLDGSKRHQIQLEGRKREHYVDSAFLIESVAPTDTVSNLRGAAVSYGFGVGGVPTDDIYFTCGIRQDAGNSKTSAVVAAVVNDSIRNEDQDVKDWPTSINGVAVHTIGRARRTGSTTPEDGSSELTCTVDSGTPVTTMKSNIEIPDGQVGLRTFGMTVWFDYFFYVEAAPAL